MRVMHKAGMVCLLFCIGACASTATVYMRYVNNNDPPPSRQQWMQDRYACMQETQHRVSGAYINQFGGAAASRVVPTCNALAVCLAAKGYYRSDTANVADMERPGSYPVLEGTLIQCTQ